MEYPELATYPNSTHDIVSPNGLKEGELLPHPLFQ